MRKSLSLPFCALILIVLATVPAFALEGPEIRINRIIVNDLAAHRGETIEIIAEIEYDRKSESSYHTNSYYESESWITETVKITEYGPSTMHDVKIAAMISELGIISYSKDAELNNGDEDTLRVMLDIPRNVSPGEYCIRIYATNDFAKRIKHRCITIY